jgi:hypothetical protein
MIGKVTGKNKYMYVHVKSEYFNSSVKLKNDIVIEAEAALKFMLGWTIDEVTKYAMDKYWEVMYA